VSKVVEPDLIAQPQLVDLPEVVPQSQVAGPSRTRSASVLSDPSTDNDETASALTEIAEDDRQEPEPASHSQHHPVCSVPTANRPEPESHVKQEELEVELEGGEDEIEEEAQGPKPHVRDWADLRKEIKDNLKKNSKTLPLSHINQLMIISNFATLRLKGVSRTQASLEIARQWHEGEGNWFARRVWALAQHYQIFEELPVEKRGGSQNARSWLYDEKVRLQTMNWLTSQKTDDVTPRKLQQALNDTIFPDLNIAVKNPISERTARRWLIKLGWRRTAVRKGVYMDGHEREDVVEYRNKVFLPAIAKFERRMAQHAGPELKKIMPEPIEGQRRIIIQYHDESCFHANDDTRNLWLRAGEQPL
jgi:hypothetical protein